AHDAAVLNVAAVNASRVDDMNVIPHEARKDGTMSTFSPAGQEQMAARMQDIVDGIAAAIKSRTELEYKRLFPATINTPHQAELVVDVATELFGADRVVPDLVPSMGSEDFSFMLQQRPGAYFRLGQGGADSGCVLHNAAFDFNDAVI